MRIFEKTIARAIASKWHQYLPIYGIPLFKISLGECYFLPGIAVQLAAMAITGDTSPQSVLKPREIEIFTLMAEGLTNVEMAEKFNLSPKTISNTSQAIKEKLDLYRPAYITRLAVKYGLVEP